MPQDQSHQRPPSPIDQWVLDRWHDAAVAHEAMLYAPVGMLSNDTTHTG